MLRNIIITIFILMSFFSMNYAQNSTFNICEVEENLYVRDFTIQDQIKYDLQRLTSFEITMETVNQTELVSQMVNAIYNQKNYAVFQDLLDQGVDTCEPDIRSAKKSWAHFFNYDDHDHHLRCYPMTFPIPYYLRVPCPPYLLEAVQNRDIEYVDKTLLEFPDLATCGEGIETLLHQPSNPICSWFKCSINPNDLTMALVLYNHGARVHSPDRYGNSAWIDRSCTNKYNSYCNLDGPAPLGNLLATSGYWNFDWFR